MKPTLYYRLEKGLPFDNFCSDAAIGAREHGIEAVGFETLPEFDKFNIVVTSVEETQKYLGKTIPPILREWAQPFEKRQIQECLISDITQYPCFLKPSQEIKAWTGFVADNIEMVKQLTLDYQGKVYTSPVLDIISEYRVYVMQYRGIIGVKHYLGDPYTPLDRKVVEDCFKASRELKENSYTLDFGVTSDGETFLIEVNDGWAIGNYGLKPYDYYQFVKARFLQLSGVLRY